MIRSNMSATMTDTAATFRILALDDEEDLLALYRRIFAETPAQDNGKAALPRYAVDVFTRGEAVIEGVTAALAAGQPYSVAFLDVHLGVSPDGIETARRLREIDPDLNLVIVTGFYDTDPAEVSRRIPPPDKLLYLEKPFNRAEIRQLTHALGAKWILEREARHLADNLKQEVQRQTESVRQAADELKQKEAFNFALFQHNPAATTVVDRDGCVIKSNLARRRAPHRLPALGAALFADAAADYSVDMRERLMHVIREGKACELPEIQHGDRYESVTIAPLPEGAIVITHDISDRKRAEEDLVQAQKMAALGTMVSGVAHEVSNPNNVMMLSASSLGKIVDGLIPILDHYRELEGDFDIGVHPYDDVRDELPELVQTLSRAASRIQALVGDLKDFARKETSETQEDIDVNQVVRSTVDLLHGIIKKATRRFETDCADDLPAVRGNRRRLEQVVVNLVSNALEALPGPDAQVRVRTRYDPDQGVRVEVEDEGCGIDRACLDRITDPFFTTKHDTGGTGLGLSISRKIVDSHGGKLTFESREQKGTRAIMLLPPAEHGTDKT